MRIIAGLGNPGAQYAHNRHNVGFMAADAIVRRHSSFSPWQKKFSALISEGRLGTEKVLIIKPQTFMNLSGQSVGEAMRFYKIEPKDIIVIYDELDLAAGKVRIKSGGGHGGHNGIKSIDAHCGKDYWRVRVGIDHPGHKDRVHGHVLGDFAKTDSQWLEPLLEAIADNADMLVDDQHASFMNKTALAIGHSVGPDPVKQEAPQKPTSKSHIHKARDTKAKIEPTGPMADMLKKLLGKN